MKTFTYFFLILIVPLFFSKCDRNVENSPIPYGYKLELRFEDSEGNDLVAGILYVENSKSDNTYLVEGVTYQLSSDINEKMPVPLRVLKGEGYESLIISNSSSGYHKPLSEITYYFKCSHIFGDDNVYTIKTYWGDTTVDKYIKCCKYVELNGVKYPATYNEDEYVSKATIRLP